MAAERRRLLLVGGGHAQPSLLERPRAERPIGWEATLLLPYPRLIYSGMLPGWIAGNYGVDDFANLPDRPRGTSRHHISRVGAGGSRPGEERSHLRRRSPHWLRSAFHRHRPRARVGELARRRCAHVVGSTDRVVHRPLARRRGALAEHGATIRCRHRRRRRGCGRNRIRDPSPCRKRRCGPRASERPRHGSMPSFLLFARRPAQEALFCERGIAWHGGRTAREFLPRAIVCEEGALVEFDGCVVATGSAAPLWPRAAGMTTDGRASSVSMRRCEASRIRMSSPPAMSRPCTLRDPSPGSMPCGRGQHLPTTSSPRPSGERRAYGGRKRRLFVSSAPATASSGPWGGWSLHGRWVCRWKERIDRRFVRRFSR